MHYRLFLDTNIYDGASYSFRNSAFNQLREYASHGELNLVINSVVEGEVQSHIKRDIKDAAKNLNKAITARLFSGFRNIDGFSQLLEKREPNDWTDACLREFDTLLRECCVDHISTDNIDVEGILSDYFNQRPPFEEKKPEEFKDAIAVASLLIDLHNQISDFSSSETRNSDDLLYCVVSNDKGFRRAVKDGLSEQEKEIVRIFSSLNGFIDYTAMINKETEFIKAYLLSDYGADEIEETVRQVIDNADLNIHIESGEFVDDQDIIEISDIKCIPYILGIYEEDGIASTAKVALDVRCQVKVWYKYTDEFNSYWDKEDQTYLWKAEAEMEGTYAVNFEVVESFDVSECQLPDNWEPSQNYDFSDNTIEFIDYLDMPSAIDLDETNLIEEEVLEKSEPFSEGDDEYETDRPITTCPDCGAPIGFRNDGGNGFCINCASRHN